MKKQLLIPLLLAILNGTTELTARENNRSIYLTPKRPILWLAAPEKPSEESMLAGTLTIEKALLIAQHNRPLFESLSAAIRASKTREYQALSGYLPQLTLHSHISHSKKQADGRPIFKKHQQFLKLNQLIYSFAGPIEQYQIAQHSTAIAELQKALSQDAIRWETERSYLIMYGTYKNAPANKAQEKAAIELFAKAEAENQQELLSSAAWYSEKAAYASNLAKVRMYKDTFKQNQHTFTRSLGLSEKLPFSMEAAEKFVHASIGKVSLSSVEQYVDEALTYRKELAIKNEEIEQKQALEKFYQKTYLPQLSFFVDVQNGASNLPRPFWMLGLTLSWNFDGFTNMHRAEEQKALTHAAIFEKKETELSIALEVQTAYYEMKKQQKLLQANYCELEKARESFILQKRQYEIGELASPDFARAQQDWQEAQFYLVKQETTLAGRQRELTYKCGYPSNPLKIR